MVRLITGTIKRITKSINHKAEKQMRKCQRVLDKDKQEYDKEIHWKRIPQDK